MTRLNPEQEEFANYGEGPILVASVAGSGKTLALVHRIARLVESGVASDDILAVTFSKAGAEEMNKRLESLVPGSGARVGTFHSVAYQILREEHPHIKKWTVDTGNKYRTYVKMAASYRELNWGACDVSLALHFITLCKAYAGRPYSEIAMGIANKLRFAHGALADPAKLNKLYERAEELRRDQEVITFDDMLLNVVEMFSTDDYCRRRWAEHWNWVLQDEAQDQNHVQLVMGEQLAQDHRNYALIGDPSQCIYQWRGAVPSTLLSFEQKWKARVVRMNRNYRSGQAIIDAANHVLDHMGETTLGLRLKCETGEEGELQHTRFDNLDDEAGGVVETIKSLLVDGAKPGKIALLYRVNAQSRAPEEVLMSAGLPYVVIGGVNFYARKEIKDLLAYLRLAEGRGGSEDVKRCINAPFRYLGKAFVSKVQDVIDADPTVVLVDAVHEASKLAGIQSRQRASVVTWAHLIASLSKLIQDGAPPTAILESLLRETRYTSWLRKSEGEESAENSRVSNVREFGRSVSRFQTIGELLDYVEKVQRSSARHYKKGTDKIILTTIHRSKGLEWDYVFILGVSEDILPHGRGLLEEERRLFYVGVTRARKFLALSSVRNVSAHDCVSYKEPSRFLYEARIIELPENEQEPLSGSG